VSVEVPSTRVSFMRVKAPVVVMRNCAELVEVVTFEVFFSSIIKVNKAVLDVSASTT
jgi:hypothetical protein